MNGWLIRFSEASNFAKIEGCFKLIVRRRYRTEQYCTMLEHMNIPVWIRSQSSLVATVIIYKKVCWISGQLDLVILQTWTNFHAEFNSVPCRYRTEPYCAMLLHMNIPISYRFESSLVATVSMYKKVCWIAGQLDIVRLQTMQKFQLESKSLYNAVTEQSNIAPC